MIVRGVALGLTLVTVLLVQTVVAPAMAIGGVTPDLVMLSVVAVGLLEGSGVGLRYGFAAGLALDLLAGAETILGVSALVLLFGGYAAGLARPFIAASELPGQIVLGGLGVAALVLANGLLELLLGVEGPRVGQLAGDALGQGVYAAVLSPLMCLLIGRISRALPDVA